MHSMPVLVIQKLLNVTETTGKGKEETFNVT